MCLSLRFAQVRCWRSPAGHAKHHGSLDSGHRTFRKASVATWLRLGVVQGRDRLAEGAVTPPRCCRSRLVRPRSLAKGRAAKRDLKSNLSHRRSAASLVIRASPHRPAAIAVTPGDATRTVPPVRRRNANAEEAAMKTRLLGFSYARLPAFSLSGATDAGAKAFPTQKPTRRPRDVATRSGSLPFDCLIRNAVGDAGSEVLAYCLRPWKRHLSHAKTSTGRSTDAPTSGSSCRALSRINSK